MRSKRVIAVMDFSDDESTEKRRRRKDFCSIYMNSLVRCPFCFEALEFELRMDCSRWRVKFFGDTRVSRRVYNTPFPIQSGALFALYVLS